MSDFAIVRANATKIDDFGPLRPTLSSTAEQPPPRRTSLLWCSHTGYRSRLVEPDLTFAPDEAFIY